MKTLIMTALSVLIGMEYVHAQQNEKSTSPTERNVVIRLGKTPKGPKAKNHKVWQNKGFPTQAIVRVVEPKKPKGPKAKNKRPFKNHSIKVYQYVKSGSSKTGLKGPKAKNYHPFRENKGASTPVRDL